jgi:hypothetical protein
MSMSRSGMGRCWSGLESNFGLCAVPPPCLILCKVFETETLGLYLLGKVHILKAPLCKVLIPGN